MRTMSVSRWIMWSGLLLVAAIALSTTARAVSACQSVRGKFESQPVTGPSCTSPTGLCTQGTLTGGLKGQFLFTASSLTATADSPTTSVIVYTADSVITTERGDLVVKHAGALRTNGNGDMAEVNTIIGGTESLASASGTLRLEGTFRQETGGSGTYSGEICTP